MNEAEKAESDLQRVYRARTSKLEKALESEGIIIVDSSVLGLSEGHMRKTPIHLCREFDLGFIRWWMDSVPDNVFYTGEVVEEMEGILNKVDIDSRECEKISLRKNLNNLKKQEFIEKARDYNELALQWIELIKFMSDRRVERVFPDIIAEDIVENPLYCEIELLAETKGVMESRAYRYGSGKKKKHPYNDALIFFKAVLLATHTNRTTILTRDSDFTKISKAYFEKLRGNFRLPKPYHDLDVLISHRNGLSLYSNGNGERKILNEEEYTLEDSIKLSY